MQASPLRFCLILVLVLCMVAPVLVLSRSRVEDAAGGGKLDLVWGQFGLAPGSFQKPRAMAIDKQDRLFIVDKAARIQVFDRDGNFSLTYDDDKVTSVDADELLLKATAIIKFNPGIPVLVKGDRAVDYGQVVAAMVLLQAAGAGSVGLLTQPPET